VQKKHQIYLLLLIFSFALVFFAILLPSIINIAPQIWQIIQAQDYQLLGSYLRSFGFFGALILFLLQFLQSLLPIFPAVILQISAGVIYGPYLGTLIIVFANCIANYLLFVFLHRFDQKKINKLLDFKFLRKFKIYFQSKNPSTIIFLFYLAPFLTNAFIPYFAATTNINKKNFLFSMFTATLPMTFLSVYLGDTIIRGAWKSAILITILIVGLSFLLFFIKKPLLRLLRKKY
jgi:uncharacterized membrane protein YdjX (TVP38/TMEM64 family)